jgi:hypothetical protein
MADIESNNDGGEGKTDRAFTEVTEVGFFGKLKNSCGGAVIGMILFFASFVLLVWNEGRYVKRSRDIDEGRDVVVALENLEELQSHSAMYDRKLVYITGDLSTNDGLYDPIFGVGVLPDTTNDQNISQSSSSDLNAPLKLSRSVQMYQWIESSTTRKEKTSNGGERTITEYSYSQDWSSFLIDSSTFREQSSERINPSVFPFDQASWVAEPILLNDYFALQDAAVERLIWYEPYTVSLTDVPDNTLAKWLSAYGTNGFYYSVMNSTSSNSNPSVGDTRVTFSQVPPSKVSIIAAFSSSGDGLGTYTTKGGRPFLLLEQGIYTEEELFTQADEENKALAWALRFLGFILMVVSILLILQPMAEAVDIIPFVGDYMQGGMESCIFPTIAILISLPLTLFTVAVAWLAYRPAWSIPILIVTVGIIAWLYFRTKKVIDGASSNDNDDEDIKISAPPVNQYSSATQFGANGGDGGGFAHALDEQPHKPSPSNEPEIPVASAEPYVPQVYKP